MGIVMRRFFLIASILVLYVFLVSKASAASTVVFSLYTGAESVDAIHCADNAGFVCNNGPSITNSGDCGNACKSTDTLPWSKYTFKSCSFNSLLERYEAFADRADDVCSTGDKYNPSTPPVMNAGSCECEAKGPFKTCCSGTTQVNANSFAVDPYPPLEADCGGASTIRCGAIGEPACGQDACNTNAPCPDPNYPFSCNSQCWSNPQNCPQVCTASGPECTPTPCPYEACTQGQAQQCATSTSTKTCSFNEVAKNYCWSATTCPISGQTCNPTTGKCEITLCPAGRTPCSASEVGTTKCVPGGYQTCQPLDSNPDVFCLNGFTLACNNNEICNNTTGVCEKVQNKYSCSNNNCVADTNGDYASLTDCSSACPPPTPTRPPGCFVLQWCPSDYVLELDVISSVGVSINRSNCLANYKCTPLPRPPGTSWSICTWAECVYQGASAISGSVFTDTNNNGSKDAGESDYSGNYNVSANYTPGPYQPYPDCRNNPWMMDYNLCMAQTAVRGWEGLRPYCTSCQYPLAPNPTPTPTTFTASKSGSSYTISGSGGAALPYGTYSVSINSLSAGANLSEPSSGATFSNLIAGSNTACKTGGSKNAVCSSGSIKNLHFGLAGCAFGSCLAGQQSQCLSVNTNKTCAFDSKVGGYCWNAPVGCLANQICNYANGNCEYTPWIQSTSADIRKDNGFSNQIPANASCGSYASLAVAGGSPGIIYSGAGVSSFGSGQASVTNWVTGGSIYPSTYTPTRPNLIRTSYNYLSSVAKLAAITPIDLQTVCTGGLTSCALPAILDNGVYIANGNLTLTGGTYTFPANRNFVILVNGNLNINVKIIVPNGSTATFSSAGNIIVDASIGEVDFTSTASNIEGFYSADRSFIASGANNCAAGTDKRLNIAGAVIVNAALGTGTFQNNRTLCTGNAQCPVFSVKERLDFVLNAPEFIKHPNYTYQELAP